MKNVSLTTDDLRMLMAKDFVDYYNKKIKDAKKSHLFLIVVLIRLFICFFIDKK